MHPIYIASHEFPPAHGGIATLTLEIAQAFHHLGYPLHLLVPNDSALPQSFDSHPHTPLEVERVPIRQNHGLRSTWIMAKKFKQYEKAFAGAVLLLTEPGPIRAFYLAVRLLNFTPPRLWLVVHGSELMRGLHSPLWGLPLRLAFQRAEKIATVSNFNADLLARGYGLDRSSVTILPLAAPSATVNRARQLPLKPTQAKARLRLLTVARLHPRKGQDKVLYALAQLPSALLDRIEYHIIGSGRKRRYQTQLRKIVRRHNLPVTFLGAVDAESLSQHYAEADIFILTSRKHRSSIEGFGLVYLEANCFGLPVIGTQTGGTADAIINGVNGVLLQDPSANSIATAIQQLVSDDALRNKMAAMGRQRALARSWESVAAMLSKKKASAAGAADAKISQMLN